MTLPPLRGPAPRAALALAASLAGAAVAPAAADAQSLRGSRASVERMHGQAVAHGLDFLATPREATLAARRGEFVRLDGNHDYTLHLVSLPWVTDETRLFVERLAGQYRSACGEQLVVTSALRPTTRQPRNSVDLSVHPTGMAVDLRRPSNGKCLTWLRSTLLELEGEGVIEATEERRPPHFHVAVFPRPYARYAAGAARDASPPRAVAVAEAPARARPAVATAVRTAPTRKSATRHATAANVRRHRVRAGETLWDLARRYKTTVRAIKVANGLSGSRIKPGQRIVIPARA